MAAFTVLVTGVPGTDKTTLASEFSVRLGLPGSPVTGAVTTLPTGTASRCISCSTPAPVEHNIDQAVASVPASAAGRWDWRALPGQAAQSWPVKSSVGAGPLERCRWC